MRLRFAGFVAGFVVACGQLATIGCGAGLSPVHGKVMLPDGSPAAGCLVVFESQGDTDIVTARGDVEADGTFELRTSTPGDGVRPGTYNALVAPPPVLDAEAPAASPFDPKFSDFKTSGLQFEVKPGSNEFTIKTTK